MTAHEDHPKLIVADPVLAEMLIDRECQRPFTVEIHRKVVGECPPRTLAADRVDGAVSRGGQ